MNEQQKHEICKNWGTANGWNAKTEEQFQNAYKLHKEMMKNDPTHHEFREYRRGYTYSRYACTCGFEYSEDYS